MAPDPHGDPRARVAVLGLGAMGARMARRLLDAGHAVAVYNRSPGPAAELAAAGARAAATPRAAAEGADVVLSMVTDDAAARAVWLDEAAGAAHALAPGAVALESSTVTPDWVRALGPAVAARGAALLDAPVVGSRPQAEAGQLVFLVGGDAGALDRARPVLGAMGGGPQGGAVHHVGALGDGAALKLAANALFAVQVAAVAELRGLLGRAGLDPARAVEVLGTLPVVSPAAKAAAALMQAGDHAPRFPVDLVAKDVRYARALGDARGAELPVVGAVAGVLAEAQARGLGGENLTAVARLYGA